MNRKERFTRLRNRLLAPYSGEDLYHLGFHDSCVVILRKEDEIDRLNSIIAGGDYKKFVVNDHIDVAAIERQLNLKILQDVVDAVTDKVSELKRSDER